MGLGSVDACVVFIFFFQFLAPIVGSVHLGIVLYVGDEEILGNSCLY